MRPLRPFNRKPPKPVITAMPRGCPEWNRRADAWGRHHGMPAHRWLGPGDPKPEPALAHPATDLDSSPR